MTNLSGISLICFAGDGAGFTSPVCAPANVAVIPSTARPATPTITLHTDLFMLPPLPLLTGCNGGQQFRKFIIITMMLTFAHGPSPVQPIVYSGHHLP